MQDYTIDYEEYFNRQMVGCTPSWPTGSDFKWIIWLSWYCTNFTAYGNENPTNRRDSQPWDHDIYYCSSKTNKNTKDWMLVVKEADSCKIGWRQSYRQYETFFIDVWEDTDDEDKDKVWDWDDYNLGFAINGANAIPDADHIQELYLISHDGKSRLFFRRKLYKQNAWYNQYKIEMLRLRWFDAGRKHNFNDVSSGNVWIYDWKIDTRACDYWMWFKWNWKSISWAYADYNLPKDVDDCWIPLTHWSSSVLARNIWLSPTTDSDLSWNAPNRQINAYMKILTVNWVYIPYYLTWSMSESFSNFKVPLETTINMKDFYIN